MRLSVSSNWMCSTSHPLPELAVECHTLALGLDAAAICDQRNHAAGGYTQNAPSRTHQPPSPGG